MCGRARCSLRADDIPRACRRTAGPTRTINMDRYRPSNNVSPGFNLPVVRRDHGNGNGDEGYAIHCMRWGLIPSFTKKTEKPDFYRMVNFKYLVLPYWHLYPYLFNARSESLGEMASFRRLLPKSRCLVAVEGFYEWKKDGSKKQPYYIHFKDDRPLVFAALYDSWHNSEGEILYTFTIVTTSSSSALQWLHDRMPVILGDKEAVDTWLTDSSAANFKTVLKPYEDSDLVWYPVTPAMGKPSFDGPECIKEIILKMENKSSISKFFSRKETKGEKEENLEKSGTPEESDIAGPPKSVEEHDTEDKSTISKFSSSKEIKEEEDVDLEEMGTLGESDSTHLLKSTDEEHGTEDKLGSSSVAKILDRDIKPCVPSAPCEGGMKSNIKREHKELVTDSKLNTDENENSQLSPSRKKAKLKDGSDKQPTRVLSQAKKSKRKGVDDKQPTLLSFFSKK